MTTKPPNTSCKTLAGGKVAWYWRPNQKDVKKGCTIKPHSLGTDQAEAFTEAARLNEELHRWRNGLKYNAHPAGTIAWLLNGFLQNDEITHASHSSQKEYRRLCRYICEMKMRGGSVFGDKSLDTVTVKTATQMHRTLVEQRSVNTANRALAMAAYAWDLQYMLHEDAIGDVNVFRKVRRGRVGQHISKETQPVTYDELMSFVSACIAEGEIGLAFGARLIWDMHIRPTEAFGTSSFDDWRPPQAPHNLWVNVDKTSRNKPRQQSASGWLPLDYEEDGRMVCLMPELQSLYNLLPYRSGLLCQRERRISTRVYPGEWQPIRNYSKLTAQIRQRCGLGPHFTMAGIRHGGLSELSSLSDSVIQSRSRHRQRQTLSRYIHSGTEEQTKAQLQRVLTRVTPQTIICGTIRGHKL